MAKQAEVKTNAMRALDQRRLAYTPYFYDENIRSAQGVADAVDVPADHVFKTLVMLRSSGRPLLVMVPGTKEVDMRALAREIGAKDVHMAPKQEAETLTGLQTGGIGALALLGKPFDVFIDEHALALGWVLVNAGKRGINLRLESADLIAATGARPISLADQR